VITVKRKMYIFVIIMGMLLISSCNNTKDSNETTDPRLAEQATDYNTIFESVSLQDEENYQLKRITTNGEIIETLDKDRILLNKDSDLIVYDGKEDKETILIKNMWNPVVSRDKTIIAYENSEGIQLLNMKDKTSKLLYKFKDEISRNLIISSDNRNILLQTIKDEKFHTILLNLKGKTKAKQVNLQENDNFIITNLIYLAGNKLFATAEIKKEKNTVDEEELIKTTDIVMINLGNKQVKNITNMKPEDQTYFLDRYEDKLIIEIVENTVNEEELITSHTIKRINTSNGALYSTNIKVENSTVLKLVSNEKEYVSLEQPEERDSKFPKKKEIKRTTSGGGTDIIGTIYTGIPTNIFIQDNKIVFKSNGDIYIITIING